jgi:alkanesulfonate monooxygenase SsuD/methylene tetrahydromethanopterin reductase-like flavin-dependent oxidoreductase (luciferase family)
MKFGILASHQYPQSENLRESLKDLFSLVEYAAELQYDSVYAIHHYVANLQTPQVISMTGALLRYSGDMAVGTAILLLPFMHPVHVAEEYATLDHLADGKLILGVGAGYRDAEFDAFSLNKRERGSRLSESIDVIRKLWTGEPVYHQGKYFSLDGQKISVKPLQKDGPPIWVGAGAFPAIERAARIGDAWLAPGNPPTEGWFDEAITRYNSALSEAGRTAQVTERPVIVELYCAATDELAREQSLPYVKDEYFTYSDYKQLSWQKSRFDYLWEKVFLVGSPETIARKVNDLSKLGFNQVIFRPFWIGMPMNLSRESIRLVASEVRPLLEEGL